MERETLGQLLCSRYFAALGTICCQEPEVTIEERISFQLGPFLAASCPTASQKQVKGLHWKRSKQRGESKDGKTDHLTAACYYFSLGSLPSSL